MRNIIIPLVGCIPAFGLVVAETPATYSHISEAVEIVNFTTGGAPALFSAEKLQLTHRALRNFSLAYQNKSIVDLFMFGQESIFVNTSERRCKLLPSDPTWPDPSIWRIFDDLLGGSLIETAPLAASCYPPWLEYSANNCKMITKAWFASDVQ
jgi:hypothetical protein